MEEELGALQRAEDPVVRELEQLSADSIPVTFNQPRSTSRHQPIHDIPC
jgi:hypothetical protein